MTKADHSSAPVRVPFSSLPDASGLYDPRFEHDACGVSFVVDVKGRATHETVATALGALCNLDHRGASGAEPLFGVPGRIRQGSRLPRVPVHAAPTGPHGSARPGGGGPDVEPRAKS